MNTNEGGINRKKDYSFLIAFFLIFSFFVLFAIRPNIETAFQLQKELSGLNALDKNYNDVISRIIYLQTAVEQYRDDLPLLFDALPDTPQVNKILSDIQTSASSSGLVIRRLEVSEVSLIKATNANDKTKQFLITLDATSGFPTIKSFMDSFLSQRRLKVVKKLDIVKQSSGSDSGDLRISMEVEGYYL